MYYLKSKSPQAEKNTVATTLNSQQTKPNEVWCVFMKNHLLLFVCIIFAIVGPLYGQEIISPEIKNSNIAVSFHGLFENRYFSEKNYGFEFSLRHDFFKVKDLSNKNFYFLLNANYLNYETVLDTKKNEDYAVTIGLLNSHWLINDGWYKLLFLWGVEAGALYKNDNIISCWGFNSGFAWELVDGLNFEFLIKNKHNKTDKFHIGANLGLSYSF